MLPNALDQNSKPKPVKETLDDLMREPPKPKGDGARTSDRDHTGKTPLGGGVLCLRTFGVFRFI